MNKKIPIYDICAIRSDVHGPDDLLVSRFAPYLAQRQHLFLPHKHNFYHVVYFTRGSGTHTIDFVSFPVKAGEIYFMAPGQVHSWQFKSKVDGYVLNFSENFFRSFLLDPVYLDKFSFFSGAAESGVVFLPASAQNTIKGIFENILTALSGNNRRSDDLVRVYMLEIFSITAGYTKANALPGKLMHGQSLVHAFRKLVNEKFLQLRLPKDYATLLFTTPNRLNSMCRQVMGKPAGVIIRERILLEAKRLLVNADLNISEIAHYLGFTDHSHFSRFFKSSTGENPEGFRKRIFKINKV